MKKITFFIFFLFPLIGFSQLDIVVTTNIVPLYPSDGDTLSACRDSMIIFEAEVSNGVEPYEYFWDFDDGRVESGIGLDSLTNIYDENLSETFEGGGGFRVKLKVIDANSDEGFIIQPIKVAIPPNYSQTKVDLPEGQTGICKGSPAPLYGHAYPNIWEDEPMYEIIEDPRKDLNDLTDYTSSLLFDEFSLGANYASGDLDTIGLSIIHSNMGNIKVSLSCEAGNTVVLKDFDAVNNSVLGDTVNNEPYLYYFAESSGLGIMNNNTSLPYGSVFQSEESFDNFIGCSLNGSWNILIEDNQAVDSGFVYSWSVVFNENILPDVWTFKDTLIQYKIINDIVYGTYWSGENVDATVIALSGDSIIGLSSAAPVVPGNNGYDFHVVNNFGCPQDTSITLRVEELTFTAEPNPVEAIIDSALFTNTTSWVAERYWDFGEGDGIVAVVEPDSTDIYKMYEEKGFYTVILIANDEFGCEDTDTLILEVIVEPTIFEHIPTMFSPNGDEINDVYIIPETSLQGMEDFLMIIYNRWGDIVYKAESMEEIMDEETGWNGKIRTGTKNNFGILAAPGVYFYVIRANGKDENEYRGTNKTKNLPENLRPEGATGTIRLFR